MKAPISRDAAATEIENIVYAATIEFFERLEGRLLWGNGHHMAQSVAADAATLVRERWVESPNLPPKKPS